MKVSYHAKHNWRNKVNKNGRYPVHVYVYIDGYSAQYYRIKLPQEPSVEEWRDKYNAWVKSSSPYAFQSNNIIKDTLEKITNLHKRFCDSGKKLTHYHVAKELEFKGNKVVFNDYLKNYIKHPPELVRLEDSTWEKYLSLSLHLDNFNPRIRFDEIDVEMAARIRNYLASRPGLKSVHMAPASVKSLFDKLLVVLRYAAEEDRLIEMVIVQQIQKKVIIDIPDREEGLHWDVVDIRNFKRIPATALLTSQIRDQKLFLLQIYGCWYYRDLIYMARRDVHYDHEFGMYITGRRSKNDQPRLVPLWKYPDAGAIMKEFEDPDPRSTYWFRRDIFVDAQVYNRNIKVLAEMAGITREVTNKVARHTGMTLMSRIGLEFPVLKRIAGQKIRDVASAYIKLGLREIIDATSIADFDKLGI